MEWSGAEGGVVLEYGTGCTTSIFFVLYLFAHCLVHYVISCLLARHACSLVSASLSPRPRPLLPPQRSPRARGAHRGVPRHHVPSVCQSCECRGDEDRVPGPRGHPAVQAYPNWRVQSAESRGKERHPGIERRERSDVRTDPRVALARSRRAPGQGMRVFSEDSRSGSSGA